MHQVAQEYKVPKYGFAGVLLVDEMSIQDDLQIERTGSEFRLVGFVEGGDEVEAIESLKPREYLLMVKSSQLQKYKHVAYEEGSCTLISITRGKKGRKGYCITVRVAVSAQ